MAAHRGGIITVIIPDENERDLKEIPDNIKADLKIIPVKWIDQVLDIALAYAPKPLILSTNDSLTTEQKDGKSETGQINTH